ncbi:uncharacterized protein E0L32_001667 [Thyridium curvatum]|uniref:ATP-dependent RNA helicase n=1 Tax=Thyridium curvatum TaxID=1093900 RepID=A0A507APB0_9PEZI|nr:uncharacterized protein E0L32_001531 [Thyridium curvatum]XP_030990918.1 uncharacterized protein E0L32_001667 [Thyridium curvatum]TPX09071.1 hypothetical protein E0L32_001531 [Thyridium curvatum]TPX09207.1 hypothetical protein E0L32_001667 [Thyridium curvatum]
MADDGMLLNFEIGDGPLQPKIKFKGGRWRDRMRAEKNLKRHGTDAPQPRSGANAGDVGSRPDRRDGFDDSDRPAKRPRTFGGADTRGPRPSFGGYGDRADGGGKPKSGGAHGVTSRLFTANPTPVTTFDEKPAEETEPAKPSNAPLSDEAENFHALGLSRRMAQHLSSKLEMKAPTAIQKNTIPQLVKEDSDAFLQAETGSGKTLAYLLPIVQRIMALSHNEDGSSKNVKIHRDSGLFAIILAPTRELCKQIATVLEKLLRACPWLVSTTVIGGESKKSEKARIRKGVNILIATPGRLTDHLDHTKVLDVGTVRWLVLDEGDRLMEMGFEDDIRTIVGKIRKEDLRNKNKDGVVLDGILPSRRVTVLCSATMKMNVQKLGEISLEDATHITAANQDGTIDTAEVNDAIFSAPSQLKQTYLIAPAKLRLVTLIALLKSTFARKGSVMKAIIFISCADSVDFHFDLLKDTPTAATPKPDEPVESATSTSPAVDEDEDKDRDEQASPAKSKPKPSPSSHTVGTVAPAAYITSPANPSITIHKLHGSLPQPVRTATLASFANDKQPTVLITTDIASRGLDVPAVDLVVEYDPAFAVADHVHRIGRTARAGRPGKAVLFLMPGCEEGYVSLLGAQAAPQLYDAVLQKALATPVEFPVATGAGAGARSTDEAESARGKRLTWTSRAEALQLHLEQRLLANPAATADGADAEHQQASPSKAGGAKGTKKPQRKGGKDSAASSSNKLLDSARQAFRSHVRAYATHTREERVYFDLTQLHLGHLAKSYGLREAPGGIGGGVQRRGGSSAAGGKKGGASGAGGGRSGGGAGGAGSDDEGGGGAGQVDEGAARRMREKMRAVMDGAGEFNIG